MGPAFRIIHLLVSIAFVLGNIYLFALWCFALWRTGLVFFWLLAVSAALFLFLAVIQFLLSISTGMAERFLGREVFLISYDAFLAVQPFAFLLAIVGHTVLVRWVVRSHSRVDDMKV
jgi:hypothetical protein